MKKTKGYFLVLLGLSFMLLPSAAGAFLAEEVINHGAPEAYFFEQEFDKLILDVTIPSGVEGEGDALKSITFQSEGTVKNAQDFTRLVLWADEGEEGFQGMSIDKKLGELEYSASNVFWYLDNIDVEVPVDGLRIFVSADIKDSLTHNHFFKMRVSALLDYNQNGAREFDDLGVFLQSGNNGPSNASVVNVKAQTVRDVIVDSLSPKTVITYPSDNLSIIDTVVEIKGRTRDQGGSTIQSIKIGIKPESGVEVWNEAILGAWDGDEQNWSYIWQNIEPGKYTLRTKSTDWNNNEGTSEQELEIVIQEEEQEEPEPEPESETEPEPEQEPEPEPEPDLGEDVGAQNKDAQITALKEQIAQIQQMLINLIKQFIELLKNQISQ